MLPICILTIEDESDREFMAGVYTQYQWLMYDTIKQVMGDHWSAEDVVQTTLVRLIDKLEKLKTLDERHMVNYIITACKHTAYNEVRKHTRHPVFSMDEARSAEDGSHMAHNMESRLIHEEDLRADGRHLGQAGRAEPLRAGGPVHPGENGRGDRQESGPHARQRPYDPHKSTQKGL